MAFETLAWRLEMPEEPTTVSAAAEEMHQLDLEAPRGGNSHIAPGNREPDRTKYRNQKRILEDSSFGQFCVTEPVCPPRLRKADTL